MCSFVCADCVQFMRYAIFLFILILHFITRVFFSIMLMIRLADVLYAGQIFKKGNHVLLVTGQPLITSLVTLVTLAHTKQGRNRAGENVRVGNGGHEGGE